MINNLLSKASVVVTNPLMVGAFSFMASIFASVISWLSEDGLTIERFMVVGGMLLGVIATFLGVMNTSRNDALKNMLVVHEATRAELAAARETIKILQAELERLSRKKPAKKRTTKK